MRNVAKILLITVIYLIPSSLFAQTTNTGNYSTQVISADGKTSTWTFIKPSSQVTVPANAETEDNGIIYVPSGGSKMKFSSSNQFSWQGQSSGYIPVPAGGAGTISMTVAGQSDSRHLQLYVNGTAAGDTKRLYSKASSDGNITSDGKRGPQSFQFTSSDLTTKGGKTYLHFKDNNSEMKIATITVALTTGSYTAAGSVTSTDATLSALTYNGTSVPNFSANTLNYEVELPAGTTAIPTVAATKNNANASDPVITQATSLPGQAKVVVTAEDGETTLTYTINFSVESAAPKVQTATWNNIAGSATIDEVNKTITGKVTNGSSLTLTPNFTGKNIASWTPTTAQDFSGGAIQYTFTSSTSENTTYTVSITEAPAASSDATLKSLKYNGTSVPSFSATTLTYNVELASETTAIPTVTAEKNDTKASDPVITQATALPGQAKVVVTAEDGFTTKTYIINFTVEVPSTGLTLHEPEVYEAKDIAGGYNTPLTVVAGREYEVYYTQRTGEGDYPTFSTTLANEGKSNGISGSTTKTKNVGRPGDTWFEGTITEHSECKNASSEDEFVFATKMIREHRLSSTNKYQFHIKGYDQFSFWGMDKKLDPKNGNQVFVVKIDGVVQTTAYSTDKYTIRRYDITTAEHLIEISTTEETGTNKCVMGGFSLRVAQEPRTKYLKGNDSTQVVYQTQAIKPVVYTTKYNNIDGAETRLEWTGTAVTGISLSKIVGDISDTLTLTGTANCPVGTYNYAVVAYYNNVEINRVTGTFYVKSDIKAASDINVTVFNNEAMDQIKFKYYALDASAVQLKWGANGQPSGVSGSGANGIYTISGTPTIPGTLPQDFPYSITVAGADTVIQGKITIKELVHTDKDVLYLYKNTDAYKTPIYDYLKTQGWNPIERTAADDVRPANQYDNYKWILISEDVDANTPEVLKIIQGEVNLPVLNLKGFTYAAGAGRLGWGEPDNGAIDTMDVKTKGTKIYIQNINHPIFKSNASFSGKHVGDSIAILSNYTRRGVMPIAIDLPGSLCLATGYTRNIDDYYAYGELQTSIHEVLPNSEARNNSPKKYICMPIGGQATLSNDGKSLLNSIITYLLDNTPVSITRPVLELQSFVIKHNTGDVIGAIDQTENTITLNMTIDQYREMDSLRSVTPQVTLADPNATRVIPSENVDLRFAQFMAKEFVVTDFINRRVYNLKIRFPQGIENVEYEEGQWVNIFDMYGRKVATTNESIYTIDLPRGIYIIVTENGNTIKLSR